MFPDIFLSHISHLLVHCNDLFIFWALKVSWIYSSWWHDFKMLSLMMSPMHPHLNHQYFHSASPSLIVYSLGSKSVPTQQLNFWLYLSAINWNITKTLHELHYYCYLTSAFDDSVEMQFKCALTLNRECNFSLV